MSTNRSIPNMPARNPWLTDSVYPVSHMNPAATDAVPFAGPTGGKKLTRREVKAVPALFVSNPTIKKVGADIVVLAPGPFGIQKIIATGDAFELGSSLRTPGSKNRPARSTDRAIARPRCARSTPRAAAATTRGWPPFRICSRSSGWTSSRASTAPRTSIIDKDGFHYCVYGGTNLLKISDDNAARSPLRMAIRSVKVTEELPAELASSVTRVIGSAMTYDGYIVVAAPGALIVLDRDLYLKDALGFEDRRDHPERHRRRRGRWPLRRDLAGHGEGGVERRQALEVRQGRRLGLGGRHAERAEGPRARGHLARLGDDAQPSWSWPTNPDKLVVIAGAGESGTDAVAFWRDGIPAGFKQRTGTKSRRVADQLRVDVSQRSIEPSLEVLGYGVAVLNGAYPKPAHHPGLGDAFVSGVTRPAPLGIQKLVWNPEKTAFEKAWMNEEIDNTDWMVPGISAASGEMYVAHKEHGDYQYVGLDWKTGAIKDRWELSPTTAARGTGGAASRRSWKTPI